MSEGEGSTTMLKILEKHENEQPDVEMLEDTKTSMYKAI